MGWNKSLTSLNEVLASLYPAIQDSYRLIDDSGLPRIHISFQPRAIDNWHAILIEADRRGKVRDLISAARADYPEDPFLRQAERGDLSSVKGPIVGEELSWLADEPTSTLEKIMGNQSTLLPINFLAIGLERARPVARVVLPDGFGTGFLIGDNLFVTNNHVIETEEQARAAVLQFNYQKTPSGLDQEVAEFHLDPGLGFCTSTENDWTLCRVGGNANAEWGALSITPTQVHKNDRVIIIQHPGGGPKEIAFYHNLVTYADERILQYLTDTLPGSSGSPVFNDRWQLVAIHHSGGHIREPASKALVFRNEGIRIEQIANGLMKI